MLQRLRNERGVAMVTVLLVGAALTVTASAASFAVIQDLRAGRDDQKASGALAYAEAGADRLILELRRGNVTWGRLRLAGCEGLAPNGTAPLAVAGDMDQGRYEAEMEIYNPDAVNPADRLAENACSDPARVALASNPRKAQQFAITSEGSHPAAKRMIRQIITVKPKGLPIGIYADGVDGNGTAAMNSLSLISQNDIKGRDKIDFQGRDPYYSLADFYPGLSETELVPAAAHAVGEITFSAGPANLRTEHKAPGTNPNCTANSNGQSLWDGSKWGAPISTGCAGQPIAGGTTASPPTTLFTDNDLKRVSPSPALTDQDYLTLKESAKASGLYCYIPTSGSKSCLKQGTPIGYKSVWQDGDVPATGAYISYFEFQGGDPYATSNTVGWDADVGPCSYDQNLNESTVLIIRNGSLSMQSGAVVTGAIILPEGRFDSQGSFTTHGTIIARDFWLRGGANFEMSKCWVDNMPTTFLDITPSKWTEVDR
jgi:hypothetical protein